MKRILIVDDEKFFRKALIVSIPWENLGYCVCGEAENGIDALEKVRELEPDVIATDINMSKMDGLTFIAELRKIKPDIKIIVISGYNEFDYVKQSITLGVYNYIMKPVDPEEFAKALTEISNILDKERGMRQRVEHLRKHLNSSVRLLHSQTLSKLLYGNIPSDPKLLNRWLERYQINLREGPFTVAALEVQGQNQNMWSTDDQQLWTFAVQNVAEEILKEYFPLEICTEELGSVFSIIQCGFQDIEKLRHLLVSLRELLREQLGLSVMIGVGNPCSSLQNIHSSRMEACFAIRNSDADGSEGGVCFYSDVSRVELLSNSASVYDTSELLMQMRLGNTAACAALLQEMEQRLTETKGGIPLVYMTLVEVLAAFVTYASENVESCSASFPSLYSEIFHDLVSTQDARKLFPKVTQIMHELLAQVAAQQQTQKSAIVNQVLDTIHNHYGDSDLTVDRLAQETFTSYGYLCYLFKRDMGKTLGDYITDYRMEQAKRLLLQGSHSVSEVAEAVGFSNPNYFTKIFKRTYGVLPSSLRSKT